MPDEARSTVTHSELVQRLFHRFRLLYGSKVEQMWVGTTPDELVAAWADELAAYWPIEMKDALGALRYSNPEWPPTAFEFANLCKEAARGRRVEPLRLSASVNNAPPDPRVLAEVHRLTAAMRDPDRKRDPRDWARTILREHVAGTYAGGEIGVRYAKEALGIGEDRESDIERAAIHGEAA